MKMNKTEIKDVEYPLNLLWAVTEDEEILENADMIPDLDGSIAYALYTLTERERKIIMLRFSDNMTYDKIAAIFNITRERIRQVESKGLRKLRHPSRIKYFYKGIRGLLLDIQSNYGHSLAELEDKLIKLCKLNEEAADKVIENHSPIRKMYESEKIKIIDACFSVRTYNCLTRAGIDTLGKLSRLSYNELKNIRNLGQKSIAEIIEKLNRYGYKVDYNEHGTLMDV